MSYQSKGLTSSIAVVILCGVAIAAFSVLLFEMTQSLLAG